jgi:hypothetical protein
MHRYGSMAGIDTHANASGTTWVSAVRTLDIRGHVCPLEVVLHEDSLSVLQVHVDDGPRREVR